MDLQNLLEKTMPLEQRCSLTEYLHGEEVPVCVDIGDDWDANFMAQLQTGDEDKAGGEDGDMDVDEEPVLKYDQLSQVMKELDEI